MLLKGKTAIVTGGTRGIGKEIAKIFASHGANVIIIGTSEDRAKGAAEEIKALTISAEQDVEYRICNVGHHVEVLSIVEELQKKWPQIDILVNNAGITRDGFLMKMSEKDWDEVLDVNLKSVYSMCHAVIKAMMKARSGKIINITSVIGLTGNAGQVNYSASKFGIVGFTRSLAIEVAKRGICVNCIAPGFIETDMTGALTDAQKEEILKKVPMQRLGQAGDIAQAALFLASSMSDYVTGQVLTVDGGMLA